MKEHFLGDQKRGEVAAPAVGHCIGQAVAERTSRVIAGYFKTLHMHGKGSPAVLLR